ncbi:DUF4412 domain-containing protein [bacterium]|nr:DUF4412 domain-containing protein [bacterium]
MTRLVALLVILPILFLATQAWAATGHQADFSVTEKYDFGGIEMSDEEAAAMSAMADAFNIQGRMYWCEDGMRQEMNIPGMGEMVSIFDFQTKISYQILEDEKQAVKTDFSEIQQTGIPQPDQMVGDWANIEASLSSAEGVTVEELGTETVQGYSCKKVAISLTPPADDAAANGEDDEFSAMAAAFGQIDVTCWVSDELESVIKMEMNGAGMSMLWELSNVEDWTPDPAMLTVGDGYEILTQEEMLERMMEEMDLGGMAAPAA